VHSTTDPSSPDHDRRADQRLPAQLRARVIDHDRVVDAQTLDISAGGALLLGPDFPSGSHVRIEIELAELGWHSVDAEVVRREESQTGGDGQWAARFAQIATDGGRDAIRAFFDARVDPATRQAA
jgi:PilZ domain